MARKSPDDERRMTLRRRLLRDLPPLDPAELDDAARVAADHRRHGGDLEDHRRLPRAAEGRRDVEGQVPGVEGQRVPWAEDVRIHEDADLPLELRRLALDR